MAAKRCRRRPERRCPIAPAALAILLLAAACEPASDRPALASFGPGGPVEPALLVGVWRCSDLNPCPTRPPR